MAQPKEIHILIEMHKYLFLSKRRFNTNTSMTTIDNCYQLNAGIGKNNLFQYILPDHSMAKSVTLAANECDGEMIVVEVCE